MTHVSEDGEDDASSEDGRESINPRDVSAVADKISVILVVGSQCRHAAESAAKGVKDLSPSIDPNLEGQKKKGEGKKRTKINIWYFPAALLTGHLYYRTRARPGRGHRTWL